MASLRSSRLRSSRTRTACRSATPVPTKWCGPCSGTRSTPTTDAGRADRRPRSRAPATTIGVGALRRRSRRAASRRPDARESRTLLYTVANRGMVAEPAVERRRVRDAGRVRIASSPATASSSARLHGGVVGLAVGRRRAARAWSGSPRPRRSPTTVRRSPGPVRVRLQPATDERHGAPHRSRARPEPGAAAAVPARRSRRPRRGARRCATGPTDEGRVAGMAIRRVVAVRRSRPQSRVDGGFEAGRDLRASCTAPTRCPIVGAGFLAVRDTVSWLRHAGERRQPAAGRVDVALRHRRVAVGPLPPALPLRRHERRRRRPPGVRRRAHPHRRRAARRVQLPVRAARCHLARRRVT